MTSKIFKIQSLEQKLFWFLASLLLLTFMVYIYLVNGLVFAAASREALIKEQEHLVITIGRLENQYLTLTEAITIARARELGFEEAEAKPVFAGQASGPTPRLAVTGGNE